jgi:glycosyltransferase involved in cell wall biosynthesis
MGFELNLERFNYTNPWEADQFYKFSNFFKSKFKVVYYYHLPNNSSCRYRAINMVDVINRNSGNEIGACIIYSYDHKKFDELLKLTDLLIICRSGYDIYIQTLLDKSKKYNKKVLFDSDDMVFNSKIIPLLMNTLGEDLDNEDKKNYWYSYVARIEKTFSMCDGSIATNNTMANAMYQQNGKPTVVLRNFLNLAQEFYSKQIIENKRNSIKNEYIDLGYFSGSPSHLKDFDILVPALRQLFDENTRIRLTLMGHIEIPKELLGYQERIIRIGFTDYVNLQMEIAKVDINLIPLQGNLFTACKSELKFFESAIVNTTSIASNVDPYKKIMLKYGGKLSNSYEWYDVIKKIIVDYDINKLEEIRSAVLETYGFCNQFNDIRKKIYSFFN